MAKGIELPIAGEPVEFPFKVIYGNEIMGEFKTLNEAKAFALKRLDRRYQIWNGNKLCFGKP